MKAVVIGVILAIAAFMGWLWFQDECRGGKVFGNEAECAASAGMDHAFCAKAFARPEEAIVRSGNFYPNRDACQQRHTSCFDLGGIGGYSGFAARPAGYCVVRGSGGVLERMVPVYRGP